MGQNGRQVSITAFFPAFNDAGSIGEVVSKAAGILSELTADYEIIVVNDGSTDETARVLSELAAEFPCLKVIEHERNRGYGAALRTGFASATKELVFYTDGDGQYDVAELKLLLPLLQSGISVVNGYKISRSDSWYRVVLGRCYQITMKWLFGLRVRDVDCDFRLFRRSAIQSIELNSDSGVICVEMMKRLQEAGFQMVEVPVHHYPRRWGRSQFFTLKHLSRVFLQLFSVWWHLVLLRRLGSRPVRCETAVSADQAGRHIDNL